MSVGDIGWCSKHGTYYNNSCWLCLGELGVPPDALEPEVELESKRALRSEDFAEAEGEAHHDVDRPTHYVAGRDIEPIDVIEDWELGFHLGNAVKYISRAGRKDDTLEDLKKARWYLDRAISNLEDEQ